MSALSGMAPAPAGGVCGLAGQAPGSRQPGANAAAGAAAPVSQGAPVAHYEIAICGAGPVGMALAALLVQRGVAPGRIVLLDAKTAPQAARDPRALALSHGSSQLLAQIGAWPIDATPIHQIHVSRRGQFGRSLIDRADHRVPALGYVARYGALVEGLEAACRHAGVTSLRPLRVVGATEQADGVLLDLAPGDGPADLPRQLSAAIVVQAEGGLFGQQPARALHRDYQQTALIAQVRCSAPVSYRAYERFTDEGPLALLPQEADPASAHGKLAHGAAPGSSYALVWCMRPASAERLLALDDAAFLAALATAFGDRLGRFTAVTPRLAYPLGLNADAAGSARMVAIGNAAQTLHPVAGQGLNLGLRDAAVLARLLAREATPAALAGYPALRRQDRVLTVRLTDSMARAFAGAGPAQPLLGLALGALDVLAPARHLLAELMMYGRR